MKNIHWLVPYKINQSDDIVKKNIASIRIRTGLFTLPIFKNYSITIDESISNSNNIDFLFIGKFPANRKDLFEKWSGYIKSQRDKGKVIYFDYTDSHLLYETLAGKFYSNVLKEYDQIITSSETLKSHLIPKLTNISIIEDPIDHTDQLDPTDPNDHPDPADHMLLMLIISINMNRLTGKTK